MSLDPFPSSFGPRAALAVALGAVAALVLLAVDARAAELPSTDPAATGLPTWVAPQVKPYSWLRRSKLHGRGVTLGGELSGLPPGEQVVLRNEPNGASLALGTNGPFRFPGELALGAPYAVSMASVPTGSRCALQGASGTANADVDDLRVGCEKLDLTRNPVWDADFADPSIIRHEGMYYAFASFGGVRILKSPNLVQWEPAGRVLKSLPTWGTPKANSIWAPDIVKNGERFIVYYTLAGDIGNPGIGVASAPHPEGPWTDHGKLFLAKEIKVNNSIDPHAFRDEKGHWYLTWGSFRGIYIVPLSDDGLGLKDGLEAARSAKQRIAGTDTNAAWNWSTYEASYVRYRSGYYYLFLSAGSCCNGLNSTYRVVVARSASPTGPYVDREGRDMRAANRGTRVVAGNEKFRGPGHNAIAEDDAGQWWLVYHAYVAPNGTKRKLMIDRLEWSADGWPSVHGGVPSDEPLATPESVPGVARWPQLSAPGAKGG